MKLYLAEHKPFGEHQFVVFDKASSADVAEQYPSTDIVSEYLKPQAHLYPGLLSLHDLPSGGWVSVMTEIEKQHQEESSTRFNLLLESSLTAVSLRKELANILIITDEDNSNYILRYYDPRVLFHLSWMLTPGQLAILLKAHAIPTWTYMLDNKWYTLSFNENHDLCEGVPTGILWREVNKIGLINKILSKLSVPADLSKRIELSKDVYRLINVAEVLNLKDSKDITIFAMHGIMLNCDFWLSHKMRSIFNTAKDNKGYYRRVTSVWSDDDWADIKSGIEIKGQNKGV